MLFDKAHIIYIVVSTLITALLLVLCFFFVKQQKYKDLILKITAWTVIGIHYSVLWVDYLTTGHANVNSTMLFMPYPCNMFMWLLLISALIKKHDTILYRTIAEFTFYAGIVGGVLGIVVNENYASNPDMSNYFILHGLLSHSVLLFGCIYLLLGGFIKIRVKSNMFSLLCGFILLFINGLFTNALFDACGLPAVNSMYLQEPPFPSMPWINTWTIGIAGLLVGFIITSTYEFFALPSEERWYKHLGIKSKGKNIKGGEK